MIKASFMRTEKNGVRLEVIGHSNHGEPGEDIVCAAVSGIVYGLCGYLGNFCVESLKKCILDPGHALIVCGDGCAEAMKHTYIALLQIAISYPERLLVSEQVWGFRIRAAAEK